MSKNKNKETKNEKRGVLYDLFKLNLGRKIKLKVLANKKEETELEFREMRNWVNIIG